MSDYEVFSGRPENAENRLERETRCYDFLDGLGIRYKRVDHPAAFTMEACQAIDAALGVSICKNLFLTNRQHTEYYLLLMPDDKPFKTKQITSQLGCARLSFASGEEMEELLGCSPGSSTILGLMNDRENRVRLVVDRDLLGEEFFGCHPCINTSSLKLKTSDVFGRLREALGHEMTTVRLSAE